MYLSETKIIKSRVELRIAPGVVRNLTNETNHKNR